MAYVHIKTELEAVDLSLDLWAFLKDTGKSKEDYNENILVMYHGGCPLCQFFIQQNLKSKSVCDTNDRYQRYQSGCRKCPLDKKELCRFAYSDSAFSRWYITTNVEERKVFAGIIYDAILKRKMKLEARDVKAI